MQNKNIYNSILDVIGNTPLIDLNRITRGYDGKILAKIEYLNPGFSKKDRVALQIIKEAEKSGELKPGQPVIELTSGNTGTGLAIVCALKGYQFTAVMSKGNSIERAKMMEAFGAEVIRVDQAPGSVRGQVSGEDLKLVENETKRLCSIKNAFRADQFNLDSSWQAHFQKTGKEILTQSAGDIQAFCDFVGTGGSFAGITKALKEYNKKINCYIVEPDTAAVLAGKQVVNANHKIQGGGYSMEEIKFIKKEDVDGYIQVTDQEAIEMCRRLAREEGIFAGFSSGANVCAALKMLKKTLKGKNIACLLSDSGLKYLSTDLWV